MSQARERLSQLLKLAADGRWAALARELAPLVLDWPADYPEAMKVPVLKLLERAAHEADEKTRAELAARIGGHPELPLDLVNELYLAAPAPVRREILMRDELEGEDGNGFAADAPVLLKAAREPGVRDFAAVVSQAFAIPRPTARAILLDGSGEALAVLCRGTGIDRATFSALALLRAPRGLPLDAFDGVPERAAAHIARHWRTQPEVPHDQHVEAAE